jgi:ribosomal protein L37E
MKKCPKCGSTRYKGERAKRCARCGYVNDPNYLATKKGEEKHEGLL